MTAARAFIMRFGVPIVLTVSGCVSAASLCVAVHASNRASDAEDAADDARAYADGLSDECLRRISAIKEDHADEIDRLREDIEGVDRKVDDLDSRLTDLELTVSIIEVKTEKIKP